MAGEIEETSDALIDKNGSLPIVLGVNFFSCNLLAAHV
jgi:hypothetical protein